MTAVIIIVSIIAYFFFGFVITKIIIKRVIDKNKDRFASSDIDDFGEFMLSFFWPIAWPLYALIKGIDKSVKFTVEYINNYLDSLK